jgi:hypothetical protein
MAQRLSSQQAIQRSLGFTARESALAGATVNLDQYIVVTRRAVVPDDIARMVSVYGPGLLRHHSLDKAYAFSAVVHTTTQVGLFTSNKCLAINYCGALHH